MKRSSMFQRGATLAVAVLMIGGAARLAAQEASGSAPALTAAPVALSPEVEDILKLCRAHVSDDTIIAFVGYSGKVYNLTAPEVVYLRQQGISDPVLAAMMNQRMRMTQPAALATTPAPAPSTDAQYAPAYTQPQTAYPGENVGAAATATAPASSVYVIPSTTPSYTYYPDYGPTYYDGGYWGLYPSFGIGFGYYGGGCAPYYGYGWGGYGHGGYYGGYRGGGYGHGGYYGGHAGGFGGGGVHGGGFGGGGVHGGGFGGGGGFHGGGGGGGGGGGHR